MRIKALSVRSIPPVRSFQVDDLSNTVVLAGPNGVGKTRLLQALLQFFQGSTPGEVSMVVEATCDRERTQWAKAILHTTDDQDRGLLFTTLRQSKRRSQWLSSIVYFESDRTIQRIDPFAFQWDLGDPWTEEIDWTVMFSPFRDRFRDTVHSIFRKIAAQDREISTQARLLMKRGESSMSLDFPNPIAPFREAFGLLLAPKELVDPDPKRQQLEYLHEG